MKIAYIDRKFSAGSVSMIEHANSIIAEYQAMGFVLTLRQLYYQFVSRDLLPNKQTEYKRLGSVINDGRLAGLIDWDAIEDRTRNVRTSPAWGSPEQLLEAAADQYDIDMWVGQKARPEVWIEKDALVGVIERVCKEYRVPYFACRGYTSQSEQWAAGQRFRKVQRSGQRPVILHLGDHDPSGIDMTRDNEDRLALFAGRSVEVRRLALNMPQIDELSPPPNPAKITDSRFNGYQELHGDESWELDALPPDYIEALIRRNIVELIDDKAWAERASHLEHEKALLRMTHERWESVVDYLSDDPS